ncbi:hypothetical protein ACJX0J_040676, partial [Zea mays]
MNATTFKMSKTKMYPKNMFQFQISCLAPQIRIWYCTMCVFFLLFLRFSHRLLEIARIFFKKIVWTQKLLIKLRVTQLSNLMPFQVNNKCSKHCAQKECPQENHGGEGLDWAGRVLPGMYTMSFLKLASKMGNIAISLWSEGLTFWSVYANRKAVICHEMNKEIKRDEHD